MIIVCDRFKWTFDYYRSLDPRDLDKLEIFLQVEVEEANKRIRNEERKTKSKN